MANYAKTFFEFSCFFSVSFKRSYSCRPAADLNSPFLPEFEGPGGFSVTDPVNKNKHVQSSKQPVTFKE